MQLVKQFDRLTTKHDTKQYQFHQVGSTHLLALPDFVEEAQRRFRRTGKLQIAKRSDKNDPNHPERPHRMVLQIRGNNLTSFHFGGIGVVSCPVLPQQSKTANRDSQMLKYLQLWQSPCSVKARRLPSLVTDQPVWENRLTGFNRGKNTSLILIEIYFRPQCWRWSKGSAQDSLCTLNDSPPNLRRLSKQFEFINPKY